MPILTKEVEVKLWGNNIRHYHNLGYKGKQGDIITVKIEDLSNGSNVKIQYLCDYCQKEIITVTYADFIRRTKEVNKLACRNCFTQKMGEVCFLRYGSSSYAKTGECQEKMKNTIKSRYGTMHYSQTKEYKEKWHNTCKERYGEDYRKQFANKAFETFREKTGYDYPSQSPEVREKMVQSCMNHYGVNNPQLSSEVRERTEQTNLERYGYIAPSQSLKVKARVAKTNLEKYGYETTLKLPEVREKTIQSFYQNSSQKASKQQRYINNLYQGILNFPVKYYNVDIFLSDSNLVVEYDGGGHSLNLVMGRETEEEYIHKEIVRYNVIKREDYKQMRIVSSKDLLPTDKILLQMLSEATQYFSIYPNHSWIEYDIDLSIIRNAENKNGVPYDYGKLRKIKDSDLLNEVI